MAMTHADKAEAIYDQGFNCAQAVFGAFAEEFGITEEQAMLLASAMGGGLGHSGEVCGAALGMALALGMAKGYTEPDAALKLAQSNRIKHMMRAFRDKYGDTKCDALRVPGDRAVCAEIVRYCVALTEEELANAD